MGDSAKEEHHEIHTRVHFKAMKCRVQESLIYGLLAAAFLFCCTRPALGVILHPDGEPNLATWTDRPDSNVVGRWSSNASFVVVAPNWIITTRHQNTFPTTVTIGGISYTCHYKDEWTGGSAVEPPGIADVQLVRLTTIDGENPDLIHYASPYIGTDEHIDPNTGETGREIRIGGYGRGREAKLKGGIPRRVYGYTWGTDANNNNYTLRWCTNRAEDYEDSSTLASYISDVLIGYFDVPGWTEYEGIPAEYDSGGGWFIYDSNEWKLISLTRAVTSHGDPWPENGESWFRYVLDTPRGGDYMDAVRISSYAAWIYDIIYVPGDLTGDDWVDFTDFGAFANQWGRDDCSELNNWCEGADFEPTNGSVDWDDLAFLADVWLTGWEY